MLGYSGPAHRKIPRDLADRLPALAEQAQNLSPRRIGDGPEYRVASLVWNGNHMVTNNRNQMVAKCQAVQQDASAANPLRIV